VAVQRNRSPRGQPVGVPPHPFRLPSQADADLIDEHAEEGRSSPGVPLVDDGQRRNSSAFPQVRTPVAHGANHGV
jgi:hypothetical protein